MSVPQGQKGEKLLWKYEETPYFVSFLWSNISNRVFYICSIIFFLTKIVCLAIFDNYYDKETLKIKVLCVNLNNYALIVRIPLGLVDITLCDYI